ncbi:hemerythrin domain-containing protein [Flavisolibacter nicotianae]|uniref:hemerythrin domain-containing protein n=1 Tax=Flavisolibacter nicotianae TaxID=2364882 RepID=UPI000EB1E373|nr:hemerythrin domain-containing protein [Flavisolibacter nicotianae]
MQRLRFNPFGQVHKGLRALLYDTALLLQHTDFSNEKEIYAAIDRVKLVARLFEHHAHIEDSQVFPMIGNTAPEIVADFEAQHQTDHELSAQLEKCIALFAETNTTDQNRYAGNELAQSFHSFLAFNVEHMKKEETVVNECLWRHYSDEDLQRKVQEIAASVPPADNQLFSYWMLKGMAAHEIVDWFTAIRQTAPPPVFAFFCNLAETALLPNEWQRVQEKIREVALLA